MKTYFIIVLIGCATLFVALCVSLYYLRKMRRVLKNMQKTLKKYELQERASILTHRD